VNTPFHHMRAGLDECERAPDPLELWSPNPALIGNALLIAAGEDLSSA